MKIETKLAHENGQYIHEGDYLHDLSNRLAEHVDHIVPIVEDPTRGLDRDGWRCQICGAKTTRQKRGTCDDRAPELDHRMPMALGGPHAWDNVQCACRRCNQDKGGTKILGQMSLGVGGG